jgi:hypothetical protein
LGKCPGVSGAAPGPRSRNWNAVQRMLWYGVACGHLGIGGDKNRENVLDKVPGTYIIHVGDWWWGRVATPSGPEGPAPDAVFIGG